MTVQLTIIPQHDLTIMICLISTTTVDNCGETTAVPYAGINNMYVTGNTKSLFV